MRAKTFWPHVVSTKVIHPRTPSSVCQASTQPIVSPIRCFYFSTSFPPDHQTFSILANLVEETNDLTGNVLPASLLVVHDTGGGGEDNVTELTGREQLDDPLLKVGETDVVAGGDDTGLVEATVELNDDLARAVVIDLLELADVAVLLHDLEELDDDLGAGSDQDLALAGLLGVVDVVEGIVENGSADHLGGVGLRFSSLSWS